MNRAPWMALALTAIVLAAACSPEATGPGIDGAPRLDEHRYLGEAITVENVTVWPVFTDAPLDIGEFLTLEEAQARGVAQVRELGGAAAQAGVGEVVAVNDVQGEVSPPTGNSANGLDNGTSGISGPAQQSAQIIVNQSEVGELSEADLRNLANEVLRFESGATVNTLEIVNDGDLPILVCAGTVVKGGNQDRQIGQDFIITAHTTVPVDAFCVEQGRWSSTGNATGTGLSNGGHFVATGVVAAKGIRASAQYEKNQSAVWENVGLANAALGKNPATSTFLASIEEDDAEALQRRQRIEGALRAALGGVSTGGPVGFAYAINGQPVTVRTFAHARLFQAQLASFLKTMAIEAEIGRGELGGAPPPTCTAEDVLAMVQGINAAQEDVFATRARNLNGYRQNDFGGNANCYLDLPIDGPGGQIKRVAASQDWTSK